MNQINPDSASFRRSADPTARARCVVLVSTLHRLREAGVGRRRWIFRGTPRTGPTARRLPSSPMRTRYSELSQTVRPLWWSRTVMGGIVASTVAQRRPDLVAGLVYVTAFMLPDGQAVGSLS